MLLQQLVNGLTLGAVYTLVALSFSLVMGIFGILNMAIAELNRRQLDAAAQHLQHALKLAPKAEHVLYAMAALNALKPFGRIPLCGMISTYNETSPPPGPNNLMLMVAKRLTMRGFLVGDHTDRTAAFRADVGGYVRDGRIRVRETVVDGIERAPEAFLALLRGDHIGKMIVRVGPDPA